MEDKKIEIIVPEAVISLNISTGYYQKMQSMLQRILNEKSVEVMEDAYNQIKNQDIKETWISDLETILIFVTDFQKEAKAKGFVKSMTKEEIETHLEEYKKKA